MEPPCHVHTHREIRAITDKQSLLPQYKEVVADGINSRKVVTVESPAPGALGGRVVHSGDEVVRLGAVGCEEAGRP